jgi:hypothetical protein
MNCQQARDWLLQAEDPRHCTNPAVTEHLAQCAACRAQVQQILQLEQSWRELPVPVESEPARKAFLKRLPQQTVPMPRPRSVRPSRPPVRWALAALVLLGIGAAIWSLLPSEAVASPALIEKLVDLNIKLAEVSSLDERARLFSGQEQELKQALGRSKLGDDERQLAGLLLDTGSWLATHDDPVSKAEHFSVVADKLVERLKSAADRKDQKGVDRYARLQTLVAERGVSASLSRAEETGALDFDNQRRLEKVILRDSKRMKTLLDLLEKDSDLSRKEIRQALDIVPAKVARPSVVFEVHSRDNPIEVGVPTVYQVTLRNQGTAPLNKSQLLLTLPDEMDFISAKGPTHVRRDGQHLLFTPLATLPANGEVRYEIQVKPLKAGEGNCRVELRAKQLGAKPLWREQKTTIFSDIR